jgi:uncharacterized protein YcbK (DUF882 family)
MKNLDYQFALRMAILLGIGNLFGMRLTPTSGYRSLTKQKELYELGYPTAKTSWHTEGKGMDISATEEELAFLGMLAPLLGLRWGGDFRRRDPVHFDLPLGTPPQKAY